MVVMSLKTAIDRIETWAYTGLTTNYGAKFPGAIPRTALPALLILPGEKGAALPFDVAYTDALVTVHLEHTLLVAGAATGLNNLRFYNLFDAADKYLAELKTDWTLNDILLEPIQIVTTRFGLVTVAGQLYEGVVFTHKWSLTL
jgi:hypothetical protein